MPKRSSLRCAFNLERAQNTYERCPYLRCKSREYSHKFLWVTASVNANFLKTPFFRKLFKETDSAFTLLMIPTTKYMLKVKIQNNSFIMYS